MAREHTVKLHFTDVGKLPPPVLQFINVTFGYSPDRVLYSNVSSLSVLQNTYMSCTPVGNPACLPAPCSL